jgi:multimeric flavodoxin WrbA
MKILAVISSARRNGTGAKLTRVVCEAAEQHGAQVEYINLYDLNFKSCGNCEANETEPGFCTKQDDLVPVMKKLVAADAIVWSSPVYLDNISGTAKTFLDRFCIFVEPDFTINRITGKKVVVILTSGAPADTYTGVMDGLCETLTGFFKMNVVGKIAAGGFMDAGQDIPVELLNQAGDIGKNLI